MVRQLDSGILLILWINYHAAIGVVPVALNPKSKEIRRDSSVAKDASAKIRLTLRASSLLPSNDQPEPFGSCIYMKQPCATPPKGGVGLVLFM